jgi:probable HAF family extracellular repeat protein
MANSAMYAPPASAGRLIAFRISLWRLNAMNRSYLAVPGILFLALFSAATCARGNNLPCAPIKGESGMLTNCGFVESGGKFSVVKGVYFYGGTPTGINDAGEIADGPYGLVDAATGATSLVAGVSEAYGINDSGEIVGYTYSAAAGRDFGVLDDGGVLTTLDPPGSTTSSAFGISDNGEIAGYYANASGTHGFLYDDGAFTTINFPGVSGNTIATGVNDAGEVVGYYYNGTSFYGFVDDASVFTTVKPQGSKSSEAFGINNSGEIVGYFVNEAGNTVGFLGKQGSLGVTRFPGASGGTQLNGISNNGEAAGVAVYATEPATVLLLAVVILGFAVAIGREKHRSGLRAAS